MTGTELGAVRRVPTIQDVARRAGVGTGTVSRVLNGSPKVSSETHARVRAAIAELGYRRNATARSLALGRSQAIGVLAPFFTAPSVVERLRGVGSLLAARGYDLVLFDVETPQQRDDALRDFASRDRLTGLLVISLPLRDAEVEALRRRDLPTVLVDSAHPALPHIGIDDLRGGELAAEHLIARGHARIAFVGDAASNPFGFTSSERRRLGLHRGMRRAGLEPTRSLEARGAGGRTGARDLAHGLLARRPLPTAVFAASDVQAVGVLEAAEDRGLRVPGDLAVMGFDDVELAAIAGLSTVRQPLFDTGSRGAELLLRAVEGGLQPALEDLRPLEVVQRRTT